MNTATSTTDTAPSAHYDLLLKGGHVIDPANHIDQAQDVAIRDGKIAQVGPALSSGQAAQVIDVTGLYVTPGLVDIHTHVYPLRAETVSAVDSVRADAHLLASGVTTTVDAGTTGWKHFLDFKQGSIDRSKVRILAFVNIARGGMIEAESEQTPDEMEPQMAASLALAFPEIVVGIKTAHYWTHQPWDALHPPWASVERAVQAGELCGRPVMVDFWPRLTERTYPELILNKLRPGDIHTHVFAQQFPILEGAGDPNIPPEVMQAARVNAFMRQARERGVLFDLGHGAGSFWFRNAVPAFRDGFPPDTLSTDLHMGNINGPVSSMLETMSKYLSMGMPLAEVIERSTSLPAKVIRRPALGRLTPGSEADVAVLAQYSGQFGFSDCGRARMTGAHRLVCRLTLRAGQVVYDPDGLSLPEWEHAPAAYWYMKDV